MTLRAEKPGVLERMGSAINATDLSPVEGRIGAVEFLGALAYTQTNPGVAEHLPMDAAQIDPRTELASVLLRLKAGDRVLGDRAVLLLAAWVRHQKAFGRWKPRKAVSDLLVSFARQSLAEWLYPVCEECQGRELLGLNKGEIRESRIRCTRCRGKGIVTVTSQRLGGKGGGVQLRRDCLGCGGGGWKTHRRVRQAKVRICDKCFGCGRRRPDDAERERVLKIEHGVYEKHWLKRFAWLTAGLDRLENLQRNCLQSQMRSGIKPA